MSKNYFEKRRAGARRCSRSNQSSKTIWPRHRVGVPPHDGAIYLPWGDGKASFVDTRDIAAVAAEALTSSEHEGKTYTLTGPAALGIAVVASILSEVAGREINYMTCRSPLHATDASNRTAPLAGRADTGAARNQ